jgi:cobalamin synthase
MATSSKTKKGSATGWILFLVTLLVLSFAAMPGFDKYSVLADRALIAVRLSLVLALSVLIVHERIFGNSRGDISGSLMQRCRRRYYGE